MLMLMSIADAQSQNVTSMDYTTEETVELTSMDMMASSVEPSSGNSTMAMQNTVSSTMSVQQTTEGTVWCLVV